MKERIYRHMMVFILFSLVVFIVGAVIQSTGYPISNNIIIVYSILSGLFGSVMAPTILTLFADSAMIERALEKSTLTALQELDERSVRRISKQNFI